MQDKKFMNKKNKGQTGETITWIVATVIIIGVLGISILVANTVFEAKNLINGVSSSKSADVLASKSLYAYVLTKGPDEKIVYEQIKSESKLNDFNGNLGVQIFKDYYENSEREYILVWLGIFQPAAGNSYFGTKPSVKANVGPDQSYTSNNVDIRIKLDEKKDIELLLIDNGAEGT